jgi:hypothetical protein
MTQATISISMMHPDEDVIQITLRGTDEARTRTKIRIDVTDFTRALFGRAECPCEYETHARLTKENERLALEVMRLKGI